VTVRKLDCKFFADWSATVPVAGVRLLQARTLALQSHQTMLTKVLASKLVSESNDNLIGFIASTVETIRDEVTTIRGEMVTKTTFEATTTAMRGDIEQVQLRLDSIEHGVSSRFEHVEGELSRLRSAVYLLGKDRPEVLRLLGQSST